VTPSLACNNVRDIVSNIHDSLCSVIKMASLRLSYDVFSSENFVLHLMFYLSTNLTYTSVIYRVSQEECARLREGVSHVKVYRYNPKHLYPKLNGYGDNGQRSLKL
jgi:hypothetical protein